MARWPKAAATPQQLATVSSFHPDSQFLSKEQCTEQHEIHRIFFFKASPKVFLIEVQLIYNVVLISAVQQSDSVISSVQSLSHVQLFATPWTTACQASLSTTWSLLKHNMTLVSDF